MESFFFFLTYSYNQGVQEETREDSSLKEAGSNQDRSKAGESRHTHVSKPSGLLGSEYWYRGQGCRTRDLDNLVALEEEKMNH